MPTFLSIEPANYCQLRCPECPVGQARKNKNPRHLSVALYTKLLHEAAPWIHTIQFYFQGEPLLNPELPTMIRAAKQYKIYTIVSTNAQNLTPVVAKQLIEAGLSKIIISMDGITDESYNSYRIGGKLENVKNGLRYLHDAKKQVHGDTHIELQCLRLKSNEHEWEMLEKTYKELGADTLSLKTAQFYDYEDGHPLMPSQEKYSRYKKDKNGRFHPKNRINKKQLYCKRIYMGCVVDAEGNVLPCCFDKGRTYKWGNIQNRSLRECWVSPQAMTFRKRVTASKQNYLPICSNCTE